MPANCREKSAVPHGFAALSGIGPKTISWLAEVGISDTATLRKVGAVEAYRRLKHWNPKLVTRNALWGLHAALTGIHWSQIPPVTKAQLLLEAGDDEDRLHRR